MPNTNLNENQSYALAQYQDAQAALKRREAIADNVAANIQLIAGAPFTRELFASSAKTLHAANQLIRESLDNVHFWRDRCRLLGLEV